jgi:dienelactone hydrolase
MNKMLPAFLLAAIAGLLLPFPGRATESVVGSWLGGFLIDGNYVVATAEFESQDSRTTGSLSLPFEGRQAPLSEIKNVADGPQFVFESESGTIILTGEPGPTGWTGTVHRGAAAGIFDLRREAPPDSLGRFLGFYASASDTFWIQPWAEAMSNLVFVGGDGSIRALFPAGGEAFEAGPGYLRLLPVEEKLTFRLEPDGKPASVLRTAAGRPAEVLNPLYDWKTREIDFRNGDITLSGTLFLPAGPGPFPVLVMTHGSGPQDRLSNLPFLFMALQRGIALFGYDKRGVGRSGGDWKTSGFDDLAGDAVCAGEALRSRPEIDARRMGVWGISQGGWVAPLAASKSPLFGYVVVVSAPAVSPARQELDRVEAKMRSEGYTPEDVTRALDLYKALNACVRTGRGWDEYRRSYGEAVELGLEPVLSLRPDPTLPYYVFWKRIMDYDPLPTLKTMTQPFLAFFGALDSNVQPAVNRPLMEAALRESGDEDFTILVLAGADHIMLEERARAVNGFVDSRRFVPDFFPRLFEWLERHLE